MARPSILEQIEELSEFKSPDFHLFRKLELSEVERYIRKLKYITTALEHHRERMVNTPQTPDTMFSVKEIAAKLKVTSVTVYNKINEGSLKTSRVGDAIRISQKQLDDFLKGN